jgi:hypothetical protein
MLATSFAYLLDLIAMDGVVIMEYVVGVIIIVIVVMYSPSDWTF